MTSLVRQIIDNALVTAQRDLVRLERLASEAQADAERYASLAADQRAAVNELEREVADRD